jgi:hypothetical protein
MHINDFHFHLRMVQALKLKQEMMGRTLRGFLLDTPYYGCPLPRESIVVVIVVDLSPSFWTAQG